MQHFLDYLYYVVAHVDTTFLSGPVAFDDGEPTEVMDKDFDVVKEALDKHDKIFMPLGDFGYDVFDEPCFTFDFDSIDREEIYDFEDDGYYDKYKFELAGYGIYIDKEKNVEYGYFTIAPPPTGHGPGITTFHDFKDAKDGDIIKEKIYAQLYDFDYDETIEYA